MTSDEFITYGCFRDQCARLNACWNEFKDCGPAEKELFDTVNGDEPKPFLASSLVKSAKMGLRFPHICHSALHAGKTEDLAAYLCRHGIREITVEGGWSSFDEDLESFYKQGWQVEGIHYLPERFSAQYGGGLRTVHLLRPALATPQEDWND